MKRLFFIVVFVLIGQMYGMAQSNRAKFGLSITPLANANVLNTQGVLGGASYDWKSSIAFGLTYVQPINNWLDFESGFDVSKHKFIVTAFTHPDDIYSSTRNSTILSIPITLRINFLKYFFVNGGGLFSISPSTEDSALDQQGLGLMAGFGANFNLKSGFSIFVNPYSKFHALINFPAEKGDNYRINENGIRIGVTYTIPSNY